MVSEIEWFGSESGDLKLIEASARLERGPIINGVVGELLWNVWIKHISLSGKCDTQQILWVTYSHR
jgi:hypothetical protein